MSARRGRRGGGVADDDSVRRTVPEVGKRPLVVPDPHAQRPGDPGKRTVSQELTPQRASATLEHALAVARAAIPRLAAAIDAIDFDTAASAAVALRTHLADARGVAAADAEGQLADVLRLAAPLLEKAPVVSHAAYAERFYSFGKPRPTWDAERASWSSARGAHTDGSSSGRPGQVPSAVVEALETQQGERLPNAEAWSTQIGADVAEARVVTGAVAERAAAAIGARAFTVGNRIFFGAGHDPDTDDGGLLAHELTHVGQQRGAAKPSSWDQLTTLDPSDAREVAADEHRVEGASPIAIARDTKKGPPKLTARQYVESSQKSWNTTASMYVLMADEIDRLQIVQRGPFGDLLDHDFFTSFKEALASNYQLATFDIKLQPKEVGKRHWSITGADKLEAIVAPESMEAIINRARPLEYVKDEKEEYRKSDRGPGTPELVRFVALELANVLARRYRESIARVFPRFVEVLRDLKKPGFPKKVTPEAVLVSHPLDLYVVDALVRAQGELDLATISKKYPNLHGERASSRTVTLEMAPSAASLVVLYHWVKATPADATVEEIAVALFGKPEDAYRLIPMKPLWGFHTHDVAAMLPERRNELAAKAHPPGVVGRPAAPDLTNEIDRVQQPNHVHAPMQEVDPIRELVAAGGEQLAREREKANAAPTPKGAPHKDDKDVVAKLEENLKNLDSLRVSVATFQRPLTGVTMAVRRAVARRDEAAAGKCNDCDTVYALADQQGDALGRIAIAMATAANKLSAQPAVSRPLAVEPLFEVVDPCVAALEAIELPELAKPRIAEAEQRLKLIDIAIAEAKLHDAVPKAASAAQVKQVGDANFDPERAFRVAGHELDELAELRVKADSNPAQVAKDVKDRTPKIDKVWFDTTLGDRLAALDALWGAIDEMDDFWTGDLENRIGSILKDENRAFYKRFKEEVYGPFQEAERANDDEKRKQVQQRFRDLVNGKDFQDHAKSVLAHLERAAKTKKWTKIVVAIAIAVVAFGLGQWQFALLVPELGLGGAAVIAGVSTTMTQAVLDKIILNQTTTPGGLLTGLITNTITFGVIGEMAAAAKGAAMEAEIGEATVQASKSTAKTISNAAAGLAKEMVLAQVIGGVSAQAEKLITTGKTLTAEEYEELFVQQLVAVIGIRIGSLAFDPVIHGFKSALYRRGIDAAWLEQEHAAIVARGKELGMKAHDAAPLTPLDRGEMLALLARWEKYQKRELEARRAIVELSKSHPELVKPKDLERLASAPIDASLMLQLDHAGALLGLERYGPNLYRCEPGSLEVLLGQHIAAGGKPEKITTNAAGQRTLTIRVDRAVLEITEKLPDIKDRKAPAISIADAQAFEQFLGGLHGRGVKPDAIIELWQLYANDAQAAINVAAQRHGYVPPHGGGAKTGTPALDAHSLDAAKAVGADVVALGGKRFATRAPNLRGLRAKHAAERDANASPLHYDSTTNSTFFEVDVLVGKQRERVRVEAVLAPRIESFGELAHGNNRIIGRPVTPTQAHTILERLNRGDAAALHEVGLTGPGTLPNVEFGIGLTSDGRAVIVRGETGKPEIDWSLFPGMDPDAHTHPDIRGGAHSNDLPLDDTGHQRFPLTELARVTDVPLTVRELVLPSGADTLLMSQLEHDGHVVLTTFVVDKGMVRKATPGDGPERLRFQIFAPHDVGTVNGQRVAHSVIEGKFGRDSVFSHEVWTVQKGSGSEGHHYLTEPKGLVKTAAGTAPPTKTPTAAPTDIPRRQAQLEAAARTHLGDDPKLPAFHVEMLRTAEDFATRFRSAGGRAVFVLDGDKAKIIAHPQAIEADVIAETYHVRQLADPRLAGEIRRHQNVDLSRWEEMSATDRIEVFRRKLHIEIDAHEAMVRDRIPGAADHLANLRALDRQVAAITPEHVAKMNARLEAPPSYLADPAYLFTKIKNPVLQAQKPTFTPSSSRAQLPAKGKGSSTAYDKAGIARVDQVGETWQEQWQITSGYDGDVWISKDRKTVAVTTSTGVEHTYLVENGGSPRNRARAEVGSVLIDEPRRNYRRVEIFEDGKKVPTVREEIEMPGGRWIQRGEDSTRRGGIMERGAELQAEHERDVAAAAAKAKGEYFEWVRVPHTRGGGGFDDVIVEFSGSKDKPKARVRVREVKDYPDRYVPLAEFTALRENLDGNMKELTASVQRALDGEPAPKELTALTKVQLKAILKTIKDKQLEFEVVLGEDTLMGDLEGGSVLEALKTSVEVAGVLKTEEILVNKVKKQHAFRVDDKYKRAAEKEEKRKPGKGP